MKPRIIRSLAIICLLTNATVLSAQQENLDDLVPYHKGKYWGIVHHDMNEFYKPVFDSVFFKQTGYSVYGIFSRNWKDSLVADVIYKGKHMWLTTGKKIIPYEEQAMELVEAREMDGIKDEGLVPPVSSITSELAPTGPVPVDSFYTNREHTSKLVIKRLDREFQFYFDNKLYPEFTSTYYEKLVTERRDPLPFIMLANSDRLWGIMNTEERKLVVPVEYSHIRNLWRNKVFVVWKRNLAGILSWEGKSLLPVEYTRLDWGFLLPDGSEVLIGSKGKGDFLVTIRNAEVKQSAEIYDRLDVRWSRRQSLVATRSNKSGLIAPDGKIILPLDYDNVRTTYDERIITFSKDKKFGFFNAEDNITRQPVYTKMSEPLMTNFKKGGRRYLLFLVEQNNRSFYVDIFGKEFNAK